MNPLIRKTFVGAAAAAAVLLGGEARGDSVAQIGTAKRISRQTVTLIDPQGRPLDAGGGGGSLVKVGDVLTFVVQFTPVPNGAYRGLGGYITDYIPPNTEVVGARIVDRNGNTVSPHRGGLACDGYGPRWSGGYANPLVNGSMSQLYADTGIFYSTDPRTARVSKNGGGTDEAFLTLKNGAQMPVDPSGAGGIAGRLSTSSPYFAHNLWDLAQVSRWAVNTNGVSNDQGNTPEHVGNAKIGYGSPVAGPDTWYGLEATVDPPGTTITSGNIATNVKLMGSVGPWQRIRQLGSEVGQRGQGASPTPTLAQDTGYEQCPGSAPTRVGAQTAGGWQLSTSNPLPAATNAVRFALGELVVGDEYFAEISLRVKALPLHPGFGNINCAEVAGGDASSRAKDGGSGGKDHIWRYFLPAPACVSLDLLFENTADKVLALSNSTVTNTIEVKNLKTATETNVVVADCFPSSETLVVAGTTPGYTVTATNNAANKCPSPSTQTMIGWDVGSLAPGASKTYLAAYTIKGNAANQAVYLSDQLPAPGFVATSWTTVGATAIMRLGLAATPDSVAVLPAVLPGTVHYTATVRNAGTGIATTVEYDIKLPAGWTYKTGTAKVDGVAAANPTQAGAVVKFVQPTSVAVGTTRTIEMDVDVPVGTAPGLYTADLTSWVNSQQLFEDSVFRQAPVAVLTARSDVPTVTSPILAGATSVGGSSTEAVGSTVTAYVNGNPLGTGTVGAGGNFTVAVPALFAGQRVEVTVTAASELESQRSSVEVVVGISGGALPDAGPAPACMDGIDNDGDGKIDFPNDPGCCSFLDDSEAKDGGACPALPKCSDGVDNDGDGLVDFPFDPGCASANDDDENDTPIADAGGGDGSGGPGPSDGGASNPSAAPTGPIPDRGGLPDDGTGDSGGCGCVSAPVAGSAAQTILASALLSLFFSRRRRRP